MGDIPAADEAFLVYPWTVAVWWWHCLIYSALACYGVTERCLTLEDSGVPATSGFGDAFSRGCSMWRLVIA